MRAFITALALSLLAAVNAEVFNVSVGFNSTLTYQPESVTGKEGDVIIFHFVSRNHTVTQSTFENPCDALASGADSGFLAATNASHPTFNYTVSNSSDWFFCAQAKHCVEGMVFAVNPTAERSFGAFQAKAKGLNPNNTSPSGSSTGTSSSAATPTTTTNAAMKLGENTLGIMTAIAVLFGLVL